MIGTLTGTDGIFGKLATTNSTNLGAPSIGVAGGFGDKLVLWVGTASVYPFSLGINNSTLWYSVPSGSSHIFYVYGSAITTINNTGIITTGLINASTNLQENGTNLSSKYLQLSGGTMTDAITTNSTAGGNLITLNTTSTTATTAISFKNNLPIYGYLGLGCSANTTYPIYASNLFLETTYDIIVNSGGYTATPKMIFKSSGNVGIGLTNPEVKLDVSGSLLVRAFGTSNSGTSGIFFRQGYTSLSQYNCSILTYDHNNDSFSDGLSINAWDGISFCTGANTRTERMRIDSNGNIGIGVTNPIQQLHIRGTTPAMLRIETNFSDVNQISGIEFGIPAFPSIGSAKILSKTIAGDKADLQFYTSSATNNSTLKMTITPDGNIGIGTTNPNNILQVGDGGRLRISNGSTDSSSIGTRDIYNFENTRIYLFGNQHATNAGIIEYISTSTGVHKFITEGINEKMRINTNGNVGIGITNASSLLHIKGTNPALTIMAQGNTGATAQLNLSTYDTTTNPPNCSLIATDTGSFGATFQIKQKTAGADANTQFTSLFIDNTGQVGIGVLSPVQKLDVRGTIHCQSLAIADTVNIGTTTNNYQLMVAPPTASSPSTIQTILQGTGYNQVLALQYIGGQVAIGSTTSISKLTIKCTYDVENEGICINAADATNLYNMKIFSFVQASSQVGYKFKVNNISSSVEALKFYYDGGVNISSYLNIKDKSIYNNLFNSSGFNHLTITDFNNITDYGYRFINSPATNGPGTASNPTLQYYTWLIGIGSDYAFNAFSAQFALPRNIANPILSVRYRENSSTWSGWTGITAEALTSGDKTITGKLTVNGEINLKNDTWHKSADGGYRLYFANNSTTFIVGGGINATFNTFVVYASSTFAYNTLFAIQNNGTTTIAGPLTVSGTSTSTTQNYRYFNAGTALTYGSSNQTDVCAKFNGSIWVTSWIASSSDIRIKKDILDINDNSALLKILAIEPKTYKYIDSITKGTENVYGFIAQQIKEIIPEAVTITTSAIPNIYKICDCNDNIITIENNTLKVNDKITIITENNNNEGIKNTYNIIEIIPELNQIKIDKNLATSNCFVYGTEVNDFHTLNKDYIFTLNVCATQELYKLIQEQKNQINDLQNQLNIIKQYLNI